MVISLTNLLIKLLGKSVKEYAKKNNKTYAYYKPTGDSTAERVAKIEQAIKKGAKVVVMPGYAFAGAIYEVQDEYKDVKFIALDVSQWDIEDQFYNHDEKGNRTTLKDANNPEHISSNVVSIVFQEEESLVILLVMQQLKMAKLNLVS